MPRVATPGRPPASMTGGPADGPGNAGRLHSPVGMPPALNLNTRLAMKPNQPSPRTPKPDVDPIP